MEMYHGLPPTVSSFEEWKDLKNHWKQMSFGPKGAVGRQVMAPLFHSQAGLPNNKGGVANARVYVEELDARVKDYTGEEPFFSQAGWFEKMLKGGSKGVTPLVIEVVRIFWAGERSKGRASPWVHLPGCVKVFWLKKRASIP